MAYAFTYIVRCADATYYTGWTNHVAERVRQHNGHGARGAKYTKSRRPVQLVWVAKCRTKQDAQSLEWFLKRLTRKQKEELIAGDAGVMENYISTGACAIIEPIDIL